MLGNNNLPRECMEGTSETLVIEWLVYSIRQRSHIHDFSVNRNIERVYVLLFRSFKQFARGCTKEMLETLMIEWLVCTTRQCPTRTRLFCEAHRIVVSLHYGSTRQCPLAFSVNRNIDSRLVCVLHRKVKSCVCGAYRVQQTNHSITRVLGVS